MQRFDASASRGFAAQATEPCEGEGKSPGLWRRAANKKKDILGLYRDNGKENGSYYSILGLYRDNGKNKKK